MFIAKVNKHVYKLDLPNSSTLQDICLALIYQGVSPFNVCSLEDNVFNLGPTSLISDSKPLNFNPSPQISNDNSGIDNIGLWYNIYNRKLMYLNIDDDIKQLLQNKEYNHTGWDKVDIDPYMDTQISYLDKSQKTQAAKIQDAWNLLYANNDKSHFITEYIDILMRIYPEHLFYVIYTTLNPKIIKSNADLKSFINTNHIFKSFTEAINAFNYLTQILMSCKLSPEYSSSLISNLIPQHCMQTSDWGMKRNLNLYYERYNNDGPLDISYLNFSSLFLLEKNSGQINFYNWDNNSKGRQKTFKLYELNRIFQDSTDFSLLVNILGQNIYLYDLLKLGTQDLTTASRETRLNFLEILVDSLHFGDFNISIVNLLD